MKPNLPKTKLPKSWFKLPDWEKDAITKAYQQAVNEARDHEEAELQKVWLKFLCVVLHQQKDPYGKMRCMAVLVGWKRMYRKCSTFKTNAERDAYLDAELEKIFGKDGYPAEWVDSLERREQA